MTDTRRLPVYVLVDCSGSMAGEPIAAMATGLQSLLADLSSNPQALDTVWLSIIAYDSTAQQLVPLTDITEFEPPRLEAGGTTALGEAVELLAERIEEEVRFTGEDQKGDWKPMVFLFTDGAPTDDWEEPVEEFRSRNLATVVACGAGPEADEDFLRRVGDVVVRMQDTSPGTLGAFIQWVTMAVNTTSKSVGTRASRSDILGEPPGDQGVVLVR